MSTIEGATPGEPRVYSGVWYNEDSRAWILTLEQQHGQLLFAAMVFYVTVVSTKAWSIAKCVLHQYRANGRVDDLPTRKTQLVLRNSGTGFHALTELLCLFWKIRSHFRDSKRRHQLLAPGLLLLFALVFTTAFLVASNMTSYIASTTDTNVLLLPSNCGGIMNHPNITKPEMATYMSSKLGEAVRHQKICYTGDQQSILHPACRTLPGERLNYTVEDVECPFNNGICITNGSTPLKIDSGFINSNHHLGLNSKMDDSIDVRRIVTCSPLKERRVNLTDVAGLPGRGDVFGYDYGVVPDLANLGAEAATATEFDIPGSLDKIGITSPYTTNFSFPIGGLSQIGPHYQIMSISYTPRMLSLFVPNDTFFDLKKNRETTLIFLSQSGIKNQHRSDDPFIPADREVPEDGTSAFNGRSVVYFASKPVSVMGCTQEWQMCKQISNHGRDCSDIMTLAATELNTLEQLNNLTLTTADDYFPALSEAQLRIARQVVTSAVFAELESSVQYLPAEPLAASETLLRSNQPLQTAQLPRDQWRREVERWYTIGLTSLQQGMLEYVVGVADRGIAAHGAEIAQPWPANCFQQRGRDASGRYMNLSMPAVIVIFTVGTIIIVVGMGIDLFYGVSPERAETSRAARAQWTRDSLVELRAQGGPFGMGVMEGTFYSSSGSSGKGMSPKGSLPSFTPKPLDRVGLKKSSTWGSKRNIRWI